MIAAPAKWSIDVRIALALFVAAFATLLFTEREIGFTRDESVYFSAGENHARWFQGLIESPSVALDDARISQGYSFNSEHPALMKNLFGLSFVLLHEKLGWLRPAAAFRFPAFFFAALILPLTYALTRRMFGRAAGIFAAVSFLLVPRQFFNAHLSCFDVPITTMWLLTVYCFFRAVNEKRWWLYTGLAFGAAIATKHNALFLPVVLAPFALGLGWIASRGKPGARSLFLQVNGVFVAGGALYAVLVLTLGLARFQQQFLVLSPQTAIFLLMAGVGSWRLARLRAEDEQTFRTMAPLVAMALLGPLIWYLHWPYLWHHPVDRTAAYLIFHATHNHYAWFYLGQMLREPPFPLEYVVVKTALTVPTSLFVPMAIGFAVVLGRIAMKKATLLELLVAANAVMSIAIISAPSVPHFGGVKHWFPSMPFLAMLAAGSVARGSAGLHALLERKVKLSEQAIFAAVAVLLCTAPMIATARVYAFGTSAYSELAGGLPGAASLGMQRQFWANNVTGVLDWINTHARPGERVYLHECHGGQIHDYQRNGMLRSDLRFVNSPFEAELVAYQYHQEFRETEFNAWQSLGTTQPVMGLYVDETPQIVVYRRK
jgi:4-amino-4-deoxy-L-arabinose transferase-like glycosyltransferase